jgi:iron complex transport system substrate-binding protein
MPIARHSRSAVLLSLLSVLCALATGCAAHEQASTQTSTSAATSAAALADVFPVQLADGNGGKVTLAAKPVHIVSLSPTATETLFAIGAGPQVTAVDSQSSYPADAPKTALSALTPNAEAIANYHPDLVVTSANTGKLVENLAKVKVPTLVLPAAPSIEDALDQMTVLGNATGHSAEAAKLVDDITTQSAAIVQQTAKPAKPLSYYYELDQTFYSVTSKTFIGQVLGQFGLTNIADKAPEAGGYPQLSAEAVSSANPDLVFLADTKCCGQSPATVAKRPGWAQLTAVKGGNVIALDDDIASRWGPRVLDLVRTVGAAVDKAAKAGA